MLVKQRKRRLSHEWCLFICCAKSNYVDRSNDCCRYKDTACLLVSLAEEIPDHVETDT